MVRVAAPIARQHRGKDLIAILQCVDRVPRHDGRSEQGAHLAPELRIEDRMAMLDLVPDLLLGRVQIQQQNDYCQGDEDCERIVIVGADATDRTGGRSSELPPPTGVSGT